MPLLHWHSVELWYRTQNRLLGEQSTTLGQQKENGSAELILHNTVTRSMNHKRWILRVQMLKVAYFYRHSRWFFLPWGSTMFSFITWLLPTSYFLPGWLTLDINPLESLLQGEFLILQHGCGPFIKRVNVWGLLLLVLEIHGYLTCRAGSCMWDLCAVLPVESAFILGGEVREVASCVQTYVVFCWRISHFHF